MDVLVLHFVKKVFACLDCNSGELQFCDCVAWEKIGVLLCKS